MSLLDELRDANEARLLAEVLARSESFWALTEARLSALETKPTSLIERVGVVLRRVRVARALLYPKTNADDVSKFGATWTPDQERKLEFTLLDEEQRLAKIGVAP